MKEKLLGVEEKRQKAEELAETQAAKLEVARAELKATQDELDRLRESSSKYRDDSVMEILRLTARAEGEERKLAEVPQEIAAAKTAALVEYQSSAELEQFRRDTFDEGVRTFIFNVWREHPEWDLSFLGLAAVETVAEFNAPPETPLEKPPAEFMPPADQPPQAADLPPQVINEDSVATSAGGDGGADEDNEVMEVDNPAGVLSSD